MRGFWPPIQQPFHVANHVNDTDADGVLPVRRDSKFPGDLNNLIFDHLGCNANPLCDLSVRHSLQQKISRLQFPAAELTLQASMTARFSRRVLWRVAILRLRFSRHWRINWRLWLLTFVPHLISPFSRSACRSAHPSIRRILDRDRKAVCSRTFVRTAKP